MSTFNLLDMAKSYFNTELVNNASAHLGESEGGISKAISAILPSIIGGISDKASAGTDGAGIVAKMATEQHNGGILSAISGFLHPETGNDMLGKSSGLISSLFGNGGQSNMLTTLISSFAGVKGSTVGTLMSMAVPTLLGLIGRHTADNNIPVSGLASMLGEQKKSAMSMLPAGFNLQSLTGGAKSAASAVSGAATSAYSNVEEKAGGLPKWLFPAVVIIGLAALAFYYFRGCNKPATGETGITANADSLNKKTANVDVPTTNTGTMALPKITMDSLTGIVNYELGAPMDITLPNGTKLVGVATNGFESNLVNFLKTGTIDTVNKKLNWMTIHDVQFVSGKTDYASPKAAAQAKNIAEILKAYPNAVLKIGGYTDITGDAAKNKALSQSRAEKLMKDIIADGAVAKQIVEAKGYGSEFAEAKAGDKEGMARDRRTAAKVSVK